MDNEPNKHVSNQREVVAFLKREISRLKAELCLTDSPIHRLRIEEHIQEASNQISVIEVALDQAEPKAITEQTMPARNKFRLSGISHDITELPKPIESHTPKPAKERTKEVHNPREFSSYRIVEGVIIGVLVLSIVWILFHYFGIDLSTE
jgi:hypothetical protein